jgi:hypothetical protein
VPLKGAVIVSTPQDIALIDARKGIAMFKKTQVPILGLVENMSMFTCPDCGSSHAIFGHGGARQTAEKLGAPFLGEIPLVPRIRETLGFGPAGQRLRAGRTRGFGLSGAGEKSGGSAGNSFQARATDCSRIGTIK